MQKLEEGRNGGICTLEVGSVGALKLHSKMTRLDDKSKRSLSSSKMSGFTTCNFRPFSS